MVRYLIYTKTSATTLGPLNNYFLKEDDNERKERHPFARDIFQKMFMNDTGAKNEYDTMEHTVASLFNTANEIVKEYKKHKETVPDYVIAVLYICDICAMFEFMRKCFLNYDSTNKKSNGIAL